MTVYLDEAATTKPKQEIIEAMMPYLTDRYYNPSSLYGQAVKVKEDIEFARKTIADFINANSNEIFFTSGGSESNCLAIDGFCKECLIHNLEPIVITSTIEHKSIIECAKESWCGIDGEYVFIDVDENGFIDYDYLERELKYFAKYRASAHRSGLGVLVSVQMANNEIGTIQNVKRISRLTHKYNAIFHIDAVQAFGQIPIDVKEFGIDMLSASGHKIGCPKGIGILYKSDKVNIKPIIYGSQMDGLRGGTENVAGIMGMAKAVKLCKQNMNQKSGSLIDKRDYMINRLVEKFGCKVNGSLEYRLPNNINVTFPQNITGESLIYTLDMSNICIASGSACNSHTNKASHVLKAIGLSDNDAMRSIRMTLSEDITFEEIDNVIYEIDKAIKILTI